MPAATSKDGGSIIEATRLTGWAQLSRCLRGPCDRLQARPNIVISLVTNYQASIWQTVTNEVRISLSGNLTAGPPSLPVCWVTLVINHRNWSQRGGNKESQSIERPDRRPSTRLGGTTLGLFWADDAKTRFSLVGDQDMSQREKLRRKRGYVQCRHVCTVVPRACIVHMYVPKVPAWAGRQRTARPRNEAATLQIATPQSLGASISTNQENPSASPSTISGLCMYAAEAADVTGTSKKLPVDCLLRGMAHVKNSFLPCAPHLPVDKDSPPFSCISSLRQDH